MTKESPVAARKKTSHVQERDKSGSKKTDTSRSGSLARDRKKKKPIVHVEKKSSDWSTGAIKVADAFVQKYSEMGVGGIKAEFVSAIACYKPPNFGDLAFKANRAKNRFTDADCLDATRVSLNEAPDRAYINANWLYDPAKTSRQYILTQAPMASTMNDFWRMCLTHKAMVVIMLCNVKENGKDVCPEFFPSKHGESKNYGDIMIMNKKSDEAQKHTEYTLEIVSLIQLKEWEGSFNQSTARNILKIIRMIATLETISVGPIVIFDDTSCTGRGSILVLSDLLSSLLYKGDATLGLVETVKWTRQCRHSMVRTEDDYVAIVKTLFEFLFRSHPDKYRMQYEKLCGKNDD